MKNKKKVIIFIIIVLAILIIPIHTEKHTEDEGAEIDKYTAILYDCTYYHVIIEKNPYGEGTHRCRNGTIFRILWFNFVDDGVYLVTS